MNGERRSATNAPTNADALADALWQGGVRHVFGHPGGEIVELIDALERRGIRFVLTGHESAAAFMAGAVGRLTGRPGVCLATLGPGACNLVLGVAAALLDRDPLLAISARTDPQRACLSAKQNLPLNALFAPITKESLALTGVDTGARVAAALDLAAAAPRGPVYLSLPAQLAAAAPAAAPAAGAATPTAASAAAPAAASAAAPAPADHRDRQLSSIAGALAGASRPIGIVGMALDAGRDAPAVRQLLAYTGLPFVVLPQAKGVADEHSPSYLGTVASAAGDAALVDALRSSDCLLGIGFEPVESAQDWHLDGRLYNVAAWSIAFERYRPTAEWVGAVSPALAYLQQHVNDKLQWPPHQVAAIRDRVAAAMQSAPAAAANGLAPYQVLHHLQRALPPATVVACDVGAHKMLLSQVWRAAAPHSFLTSNGLSAMGYGVPAALAAALVHGPGRPVVAVLGDAGFAMMVQELETAARLGVTPLLLVLCDRSLAVIKVAQDARQVPHHGVDMGAVDWARVAGGFGARGVAVATIDELRAVADRWLAEPRLTVAAVRIDPTLYAGLTY